MKRRLVMLALACLIITPQANAATLIGDTVTITRITSFMLLATDNFLVTETTPEYDSEIGGTLIDGVDSSFEPIVINIESSSIHFTFSPANPGGFSDLGIFNGYVFGDLDFDTGAPIDDVTISTNITGLEGSDLQITNDSIFIDLNGTSLTQTSFFTLEISPVPEPSRIVFALLATILFVAQRSRHTNRF